MAKTFDGPPTLERSGSEHRVGRFTSFLLRFLSPTRGTEGVVKTIEKAWLEVELPLERETEGFEKIPSLMGKSDASECNESSLSKLPSAARFINKEGRDDFRNLLLILSETDINYLIM